MNNTTKKTLELLEELPQTNSVTAYGSGFFKQDAKSEKPKELDLIISVDDPAKWHKENMEMHPEMYAETGIEKQIEKGVFYNENVSFPKSLSCFYPKYKGTEYKFLVVDKRLLYKDLETWMHFSLAGRFQKETMLLVDNSNGVLPNLMKKNYDGIVKTALIFNDKEKETASEMYETIVGLSYLNDARTLLHLENPNKIKDIVNGSYEFFDETYGHYNDEYDRKEDNIYLSETYDDDVLPYKIDELPAALRNTLFNTLSDKKLRDRTAVSKAIKKYFKDLNRKNSILLALRCYETVGNKRSKETFNSKRKKGKVKVRK